MKKLLLGFGIALFALSVSAPAQMGGGPGAGACCCRGDCGNCNMTAQNTGRMRWRGMAAMQRGAGCQAQYRQNAPCRCGQCAMANAAPATDQKK